MSDEPKLLPCPFCGGEASSRGYQRWSKPCKETRWSDGSEITEAYFCNCPRCGVSNVVSGIGYRTQAEAIAAWNARATPHGMIRLDAPELLAMVGALRAMRAMAKIGKPMVATEIMAAADQAAAAITAWEKLTK